MASMTEALKLMYKVEEKEEPKEIDIQEAIEPAPKGKEDEYDGEGDMALNQLETAYEAIEDLMDMINKNDNLPEWVQSKLTKAVDYLDSVRDYLASEMDNGEDEDEEDMDEATYHDSGWKKTSGERKDQFGNVIKPKNIAKHLAKKGAAESDPNRKLRSDEKRVNGEIKRESVEEQAPVATEEIKKPSLSQTIMSVVSEKKELSDKQKQLDVDKDGDIEGDDLVKLRARKDKKSEEKKDKQDVNSGKKEPVEMDPKLQEMSDAQMKKREEIVKSMKDKQQYFKDKYGERWKDVMYATATKMAMKD